MYEDLLTIAIVATAACAIIVAAVSLRRLSIAKTTYQRTDELINNLNQRDAQVQQLTEKLNRFSPPPEGPATLAARGVAPDVEQSIENLRQSLSDFRRQQTEDVGALSAALGEGQRERLEALERRSSERLDALLDAADRTLAKVRGAGGS
jgi:hypothetical protein